jgi:energy-coupling factor transporter ATP-binding protein EcfA2
VPPFGERLLLAGTSGSGKSTFAKGFLEGLVERGHQILVVDPEGDYEKLDWAGTLGDQQHAPTVEEAMTLLQAPEAHLVLNLLGIPHADRPAFFAALVPRLQEMHAQTGRPHWVIVDEAHHLLPDATAQPPVPYDIHGLMFITVHPEHVARTAVEAVHRVIVVGGAPAETVRRFAEQKAVPPPNVAPDPLPSGEAITWRPGSEPVHIRSVAPRAEHRRHVRKYAEGELGPERSFFFRGPEERLNLRAHNLQLFVQLADGVDDETWMHHLRRGDYSRWFRESIKDDELAQEAQAIEADPRATAADSRERIRSLVDARYTTPA